MNECDEALVIRRGWGRQYVLRWRPGRGRGPQLQGPGVIVPHRWARCTSVAQRPSAGWVSYAGGVIFKAVGESRPYPQHQLSTTRDWGAIAPQQVRLDELITTKRTLDLEALLAEDSTFFGDLFPHVVRWKGNLYLEDGLHRAVRSALHHRSIMHARVLNLDA